jgi:hypothetical protein
MAGLRGMGQSTASQPVSTTAETLVSSTGSIAATILALSPTTGPAAPFVAAAAAIVGLLAKFGVGAGCGQACILSSDYANQAEASLSQNILAYFSIPAPRPLSSQQTALALFDEVWQDLVTQCSAASLGDPGKRCISDRQAGACTWKQTANSVLINIPGEPQAGECWNWFSGYRTPIADDPDVAEDSQATQVTTSMSSTGTSSSSASGSSSLSSGTLYLVGAALLAAFAFGGKN